MWIPTVSVDTLPGQRVAVAVPAGVGLIYRVSVLLNIGAPPFYRRFGYLSLLYGVDTAGFSYGALQPLGSVWEPAVVYQLARPVASNLIIFHRRRDTIGGYSLRCYVNTGS